MTNILAEYIERIEKNVSDAIQLQNLLSQSAYMDENGNWSFKISQKNDEISEIMTLEVNKENVALLAPEDIVANKTLELARETILKNDINFKKSQKNKFEYFAHLDGKDRQDFDNKVNGYIKENELHLKFEATKEILISNGVMPRIVNRALEKSADTATKTGVLADAQISASKDNGYCTKSLFIPLYEFKKQYGGFEWLPDSAEISSHPQTMIDHLKDSKENAVSDMVNLNSEIKKYEAGSIVMVDQGNGHMHAMMYNGINQDTGKPQYIGFNSNDLNRSLSDKRVGIIINLPQMIKEDIANGKIKTLTESEEKVSSSKTDEMTITLQGTQNDQMIQSLSRGEKASYISLKIERVREKLSKNKSSLHAEDLKNPVKQPMETSKSNISMTNVIKNSDSYSR